MSSPQPRRPPALDPRALRAQLDALGWGAVPGALDAETCRALREHAAQPERFRSRVDMARHRYGQGQYGYYAHPLPRPVQQLREWLYPALAEIANNWSERLGRAERYPAQLAEFLEQCHAAGQTRPTPLLLRYAQDGFNRLHQDRYGAVAFPLQAVVLLSEPGREFEGGEFLICEQRPRGQPRIELAHPALGDAIVFPNAWRPVAGARGEVSATVRHGLARVTRGERFALGLIFHDAA